MSLPNDKHIVYATQEDVESIKYQTTSHTVSTNQKIDKYFRIVNDRFDTTDIRFDSLTNHIDAKFNEVDRRLNEVDSKLNHIDKKLLKTEFKMWILWTPLTGIFCALLA